MAHGKLPWAAAQHTPESEGEPSGPQPMPTLVPALVMPSPSCCGTLDKSLNLSEPQLLPASRVDVPCQWWWVLCTVGTQRLKGVCASTHQNLSPPGRG